MYGDFILWFRYKMDNRVKFKDFMWELRCRWFVFKRQNIECVHEYKLLNVKLTMPSLYVCKKCGKQKLTKRNMCKEL